MDLERLYRELCLSWRLLDAEEVALCTRDVEMEASLGVKRSLLGIAVHRGLLEKNDALHVHRMAKSIARDGEQWHIRHRRRETLQEVEGTKGLTTSSSDRLQGSTTSSSRTARDSGTSDS